MGIWDTITALGVPNFVIALALFSVVIFVPLVTLPQARQIRRHKRVTLALANLLAEIAVERSGPIPNRRGDVDVCNRHMLTYQAPEKETKRFFELVNDFRKLDSGIDATLDYLDLLLKESDLSRSTETAEEFLRKAERVRQVIRTTHTLYLQLNDEAERLMETDSRIKSDLARLRNRIGTARTCFTALSSQPPPPPPAEQKLYWWNVTEGNKNQAELLLKSVTTMVEVVETAYKHGDWSAALGMLGPIPEILERAMKLIEASRESPDRYLVVKHTATHLHQLLHKTLQTADKGVQKEWLSRLPLPDTTPDCLLLLVSTLKVADLLATIGLSNFPSQETLAAAQAVMVEFKLWQTERFIAGREEIVGEQVCGHLKEAKLTVLAALAQKNIGRKRRLLTAADGNIDKVYESAWKAFEPH